MEEITEVKNTKVKLNVKQELEKLNSKTIFEFEKTMDNFDISKVKSYIVKDDERTVSVLFYDNEFFAIDRVNFKDGYEYDSEKEASMVAENLNYRIKKIPNVAKTRKILNLEDIETRIYDVSEYIILLKKENLEVLRVNGHDDIQKINYVEEKLNIENIQKTIDEYEEKEYEQLKEERSIKNKLIKFAEKAREIVIEPIKLLKSKLIKSNEIKMLSDGKHSIFDKED